MLIKPGLAVSEMSGTFGGVVASHNRGGQYFRQYRIPTDPNTPLQQTMRSAMAHANWAWGGITQAQRDAWDNYAANTPWRNKLGETIYLTGFQWFVRTQTVLYKIDDVLGLGGVPTALCTAAGGLPQQFVFGASSLGVAAGLSLAYDDQAYWNENDSCYALISMSKPRSLTQVYDGQPERVLGAIAGDTVAPPASPYTLATASLPFPILAGQLVSIYVRTVYDDGTMSERIRQNITVVV